LLYIDGSTGNIACYAFVEILILVFCRLSSHVAPSQHLRLLITYLTSAADSNSRPSTKYYSRCYNIRPLTTFINERNIELRTYRRYRRPQPPECKTPTYTTTGDIDDLLVRYSRYTRYHPRSMFLSSASRRFKTYFNYRVCFL
jgi:hypothetical protein